MVDSIYAYRPIALTTAYICQVVVSPASDRRLPKREPELSRSCSANLGIN